MGNIQLQLPPCSPLAQEVREEYVMAQVILAEFEWCDYYLKMSKRTVYLEHMETGEKITLKVPARSTNRREWAFFTTRPLLWLHGKVYGDK